MKNKQTTTANPNGRKAPAKTPPRRTRPAGADTEARRRAAGTGKRRKKLTPRLKRILAMFPQPVLARICGVTRQGVDQWEDLPAKHALAVEAASGGKFTKEYLAPDFYPRPVAA